jgi:hypothetical protein
VSYPHCLILLGVKKPERRVVIGIKMLFGGRVLGCFRHVMSLLFSLVPPLPQLCQSLLKTFLRLQIVPVHVSVQNLPVRWKLPPNQLHVVQSVLAMLLRLSLSMLTPLLEVRGKKVNLIGRLICGTHPFLVLKKAGRPKGSTGKATAKTARALALANKPADIPLEPETPPPPPPYTPSIVQSDRLSSLTEESTPEENQSSRIHTAHCSS